MSDLRPKLSQDDTEDKEDGGWQASSQDEFEVEISDLAPGDEGQVAPPMRLSLSARRSRGARAWRVILVGSALLALVGILGSNTTLRGQTLAMLAGTPTPPLPPTATPTAIPPPAPDPQAWLPLEERPVFLPVLAPGSHCPTSHGQPVSRNLGPAVGPGPVYAAYGAGSALDGVLEYSDARFLGLDGVSNWGFQEVVWAIHPAYTGPVLIRGRQVDGPNIVLFNGGVDQEHFIGSWSAAPLLTQVRLLGSSDHFSWAYWGTYTRLLMPGCYAYQVDGLTFSYSIIFQAIPAPGACCQNSRGSSITDTAGEIKKTQAVFRVMRYY